jgi:helix-turn-helix protein
VSNDHESADPPGPSTDQRPRDHFLVVRLVGHRDAECRIAAGLFVAGMRDTLRTEGRDHATAHLGRHCPPHVRAPGADRAHPLCGCRACRGAAGARSAQLRGHLFRRAGSPLGRDVPAGVVHAIFYNFAPGEAARHIPRLWDLITPEAALAARDRGCVVALRRMLGGLAYNPASRGLPTSPSRRPPAPEQRGVPSTQPCGRRRPVQADALGQPGRRPPRLLPWNGHLFHGAEP